MSGPRDLYHAVRQGVGWIDRSDRARLAVTGPDRATMLHNLTTNDIKRLPAGRGCEAFVTSPQGKTLGYVSVLAAESQILLRTDPGGLEHILPHFQKYGAFDDAAWVDQGAETFELHLAGPKLDELRQALGLDALGPDSPELSHVPATVAGQPLRAVREAPLGLPGLTLIGPRAGAEAVADALREAGRGLGLVDLDEATCEVLRIEAGTPAFGRDVTPENLPQEVGRDRQVINFVKGCYLGQETVARIDALGHVNKVLKGARLEPREAPPPAPGSALEWEASRVGTVTSAAYSPGWECVVLLAYVRTAQAQPGTALRVAGGGSDRSPTATVADLPMPPPGA